MYVLLKKHASFARIWVQPYSTKGLTLAKFMKLYARTLQFPCKDTCKTILTR